MGRTRRSPYLRFQEHVEKDTDQFGRALRNDPKDFVVIQLEKVPEDTKLEDFRRRESSWINRVDALSIGYNSRREISKRPAPFLPVYGLGPEPITRSRNPDRIMVPNLQARNRSKDGLRRTMYLQHLVQNKPDEVDKCVCVFFPSILDIKFVGRTSRGHTGGRSHRIFNPPSFCGACLDFCREKDSAIPFPRRP